jgi:hypothetical protein
MPGELVIVPAAGDDFLSLLDLTIGDVVTITPGEEPTSSRWRTWPSATI